MAGIINDSEKALKETLKRVKFLVCGKTDVGKSSLINGLIGTRICDVKHGDLGPGNTVWGSSGLQDGTDDEESYLEELFNKCSNVDIVLYCMDINILSWTPAEVRATELLKQKFGEDFWKKAILVLTKANMVNIPETHNGKKATYHKERYQEFVRKFRNQLIEQGVPRDIAENLRAVAAGFCDPADREKRQQYIYYTSDRMTVCNENAQFDFLPELWTTCLEIVIQVGIGPKDTQVPREGIEPNDWQRQQLQEALSYANERVVNAQPHFESIAVGFGGVAGAVTGAAVGSAFGPLGTIIGGTVGFFSGAKFFWSMTRK